MHDLSVIVSAHQLEDVILIWNVILVFANFGQIKVLHSLLFKPVLTFLNQCYYSVNDFKDIDIFYEVFKFTFNVFEQLFLNKYVLTYSWYLCCGNDSVISQIYVKIWAKAWTIIFTVLSSRYKK